MSRMRKLRELRGWSQNRLAREAGVTHAAVRRWERCGTERMQLGCAVRIADALGVDVRYLYEGPGDRG